MGRTTKMQVVAAEACEQLARIGSGVIVVEWTDAGCAVIHHNGRVAARAGGYGYSKDGAAIGQYLDSLVPGALVNAQRGAGVSSAQEALEAAGWELGWAASPTGRFTVYTIRRSP